MNTKDDDVESSDTYTVWLMPDILVHKTGGNKEVGVIRGVNPDGTCEVCLGANGEGDAVMVPPSELEIVRPRKNDRVIIVGDEYRGSICKLIGVDGSDAIVVMEDNRDIKILDLDMLAKFVESK